MHKAKELLELIDDYLKAQRFDRKPRNLYSPFYYILDLPAKRLRPLLVLMAAEMFGVPPKKALPVATAVELFHNFTLIHDDIMDHAPIRRGKPTVHKKFGEATAVLAGDAMLVYAYQYLRMAPLEQVPALLKTFNDCAIDVCEGQQLDMNFETNRQVRVKDYIEMIGLKTAALLATSLRLGAQLGRVPDSALNHLTAFGRELGIAFQLKDDWLDAFGETNKLGKQRGGDILQKKKTILILEAIRISGAKEATHLWKLYNSSGKNKVDTVLKQFESIGLRESTLKMIEQRFEDAYMHLQLVDVPPKHKAPVMELVGDLVGRDH